MKKLIIMLLLSLSSTAGALVDLSTNLQILEQHDITSPEHVDAATDAQVLGAVRALLKNEFKRKADANLSQELIEQAQQQDIKILESSMKIKSTNKSLGLCKKTLDDCSSGEYENDIIAADCKKRLAECSVEQMEKYENDIAAEEAIRQKLQAERDAIYNKFNSLNNLPTR